MAGLPRNAHYAVSSHQAQYQLAQVAENLPDSS